MYRCRGLRIRNPISWQVDRECRSLLLGIPPIALVLGELAFRRTAAFVGAGIVSALSQSEESCTLPPVFRSETLAVQDGFSQPDDAKIAANLRRAIELTELGLALRRSVLQQDEPGGDAMVQVLREIRRAKEQAWQQNSPKF